MTDPDFDQALSNLHGAFGEPVAELVRAKCPRCRRWCVRSRYLLGEPCYLCAPTGEPFTMADLLLMVEYGLSWKAYQAKLEKYGPPWHSPREWVHSRERQTKWQRVHGTGRPRDEQA